MLLRVRLQHTDSYCSSLRSTCSSATVNPMSKRVTLTLTDVEYETLLRAAKVNNLHSPSDMLRHLLRETFNLPRPGVIRQPLPVTIAHAGVPSTQLPVTIAQPQLQITHAYSTQVATPRGHDAEILAEIKQPHRLAHLPPAPGVTPDQQQRFEQLLQKEMPPPPGRPA